jgi:predicted adenine nucleotide alpha hydrolase (AANH) superfamily ATPase
LSESILWYDYNSKIHVVEEYKRRAGMNRLDNHVAMDEMMKDAKWKRKVKNFTPKKEDMEKALLDQRRTRK